MIENKSNSQVRASFPELTDSAFQALVQGLKNGRFHSFQELEQRYPQLSEARISELFTLLGCRFNMETTSFDWKSERIKSVLINQLIRQAETMEISELRMLLAAVPTIKSE